MVRRYVAPVGLACALVLGTAGSAFADSVTIDASGADSDASVTMDNSTTLNTTTTNAVNAANINAQQARSGNVADVANTSVGGVSSGSAFNNSVTHTSITVSNGLADVPLTGGGNPPTGGSGALGGGTTNGGSSPVSASFHAGSVLGASVTPAGSGGHVAILPVTGATVPVDVSALRAAWHPQTPAPLVVLQKNSQWFTRTMLVTATLLSLLGALGSAWYARRREERV